MPYFPTNIFRIYWRKWTDQANRQEHARALSSSTNEQHSPPTQSIPDECRDCCSKHSYSCIKSGQPLRFVANPTSVCGRGRVDSSYCNTSADLHECLKPECQLRPSHEIQLFAPPSDGEARVKPQSRSMIDILNNETSLISMM